MVVPTATQLLQGGTGEVKRTTDVPYVFVSLPPSCDNNTIEF